MMTFHKPSVSISSVLADQATLHIYMNTPVGPPFSSNNVKESPEVTYI